MSRVKVVRRRVVAAVVVPACLVLAGCGAASLPAPTTTLPTGARVGPQVFLGDSAATTAAIRNFAATLGANGQTLTVAQAKAEAPSLDTAVSAAQLGLRRLTVQEVDDSRLDAQRQAILGPLGTVVAQMSAIDTAAHAGDVNTVVAHLAPLRAAITALQQAGGS